MPALKMIDVTDLFVDPAYQRPVQSKLVETIARDFKPELLQTPDVSERPDGTHAIIDGQQRWTGVVKRGAPQKLRCNVHTGLSREDEAALFVELNKRRKQVSSLERFVAARFYGEPMALDIDAAVRAVNMDIGALKGGRPETRIAATATLERIYNRWGREGLDRALQVAQIWRGDPKSNTGHWIMGLAVFTQRHGTVFTVKQRQALENVVPARILRQAVGDLTALGGSGAGDSVGIAVAERLRAAARMRRVDA